MKKLLLGTLVVIALLGFTIAVKQLASHVFSTQPQQTVVSVAPTAEELLRLVNEERAKADVKPLALDPLLNQSAQLKADEMLANNYFGHVDANGKHGYELIAEVGKKCVWHAENLFWGRATNTSAAAIDWWKNSEPHRKAMLSVDYESTGFGIAGDKVVQHFCNER